MFIRVLGAAAGGGYPQWNCNHPNSRLARSKNNNAIRFIEKNLARSFVRFWNIYSDNKVNGSESIENHEIIEFFMISIEQAYLHYSEIEWFNSCNLDDLKNLFKSI